MTSADRKNLEKQIVRYQPKLRSFIRGRVANREDAEDILQDVLFQWTKAVDIAMSPIENLSAWLYRVARNLIINLNVKKKEEEMPVYHHTESDSEMLQEVSDFLFDGEMAVSPETEYLRSLVWEELERALEELPIEQRQVFELTEFDGLSFKDISKTTGISVATLLSRKHYAVLHLRERLAELYSSILEK